MNISQVKRICDRHYGIGSDGILVDYDNSAISSLRIINPDGSEAEKSIMRLLGAALTEQNEEWLLQNCYLPQHSMAEIEQTLKLNCSKRCPSALIRHFTGPEGWL